MKYCPIDLSLLLSCKQMFNNTDSRADDLSVCDQRFKFNTKKSRIMSIPFLINGIDSLSDNLICNNQKIDMPEFPASSIAILGFAEYSCFTEQLLLTFENGCKQCELFTLYGISENIDSLYETDLNADTQVAFSAKGKYSQKMSYFISRVYFSKKICSVTLPNNSEVHIAAMTLCK